MFALLFAYVFGGAIQVADGGYKEFLMGGIFAQTIVFGAFGVAITLADDRTNGAIDRFRSLPLGNGAVLGGHAVASLLRSTLPILLMSICGLIVGWRINAGVVDAVHAYVLMLGLSFAVVWVGVLMGSLLPTPEAVQGVAFTVIFPVTFIASTFVPVSTLPGGPADDRRVEPRRRRWRSRSASCSATHGATSARTRPGRWSTRSPTAGSGSWGS